MFLAMAEQALTQAGKQSSASSLQSSLWEWILQARFTITVTGLNKPKLNSVAWVRERTIPTERLPLVGEVSANFSG
jgi:hypothetical protein